MPKSTLTPEQAAIAAEQARLAEQYPNAYRPTRVKGAVDPRLMRAPKTSRVLVLS